MAFEQELSILSVLCDLLHLLFETLDLCLELLKRELDSFLFELKGDGLVGYQFEQVIDNRLQKDPAFFTGQKIQKLSFKFRKEAAPHKKIVPGLFPFEGPSGRQRINPDFPRPHVFLDDTESKFQRLLLVTVADLVDLVENEKNLIHKLADVLQKLVLAPGKRRIDGDDEDSRIGVWKIGVSRLGIVTVDRAGARSVDDADPTFKILRRIKDRDFFHFLFVLRIFALCNKGRKTCNIDFFQSAVQILYLDLQLWTVAQNCDNGSKRCDGCRQNALAQKSVDESRFTPFELTENHQVESFLFQFDPGFTQGFGGHIAHGALQLCGNADQDFS